MRLECDLIKKSHVNNIVNPYFLYNNLWLEAIVRGKPRTIEKLK